MYKDKYLNSIKSSDHFVTHFKNLVQSEPNKKFFCFLNEQGLETDSLTTLQLNNEAENIAGYLQDLENYSETERCILICNPGRDFIVSFLGCLYGNLISVPCKIY